MDYATGIEGSTRFILARFFCVVLVFSKENHIGV